MARLSSPFRSSFPVAPTLLIASTLVLTGVLAGCASSNEPPREIVRDGSRTPGLMVISREDLYDMEGGTAYDAILRYHPRWLRPKQTGFGSVTRPVLVVDDQQMELELLNSYRVEQIEEIRYVEPRDATMRYGTGFTGGAIELSLRGNSGS